MTYNQSANVQYWSNLWPEIQQIPCSDMRQTSIASHEYLYIICDLEIIRPWGCILGHIIGIFGRAIVPVHVKIWRVYCARLGSPNPICSLHDIDFHWNSHLKKKPTYISAVVIWYIRWYGSKMPLYPRSFVFIHIFSFAPRLWNNIWFSLS